mgnify:CR=1 FL=1
MGAKLFVALQRLLPTLALTGLAHRLAASRHPRLSQWLIGKAIRSFQIDMAEAANPDPASYDSFNAFFTRALKSGARPLAPAPALASPVDGRVSQLGAIDDGRIIQAKGSVYSVAELLADPDQAQRYRNGRFATLYLAPADYHRIHMPLDGALEHALYQPGRLLAVNPPTVSAAPRLFARNERLVCHFRGGPQAPQWSLVMVGALFVSGLETRATGVVTPKHGGAPRDFLYDTPPRYERGEEFGRFNYGSTVILLLPAGWHWAPTLEPGQRVRMGEALAMPEGAKTA